MAPSLAREVLDLRVEIFSVISSVGMDESNSLQTI